jgi:hypothetical protein
MRDADQRQETLLARLLADAEFLARFKRDPLTAGRELSLDAAELAAYENADWTGLDLAVRSYAHKRGR